MVTTNTKGPILHVKRKGSIGTFYCDFDGRPLALANYDDQPPDGLGQTLNINELPQRFPGWNIIFHDAPETKPIEVKPVSSDKVAALLQKLGIATEKIDAVLNPSLAKSETVQTMAAQVIESNNLMDKALQEFKVLLAKYYADVMNPDTKLEVQAVANFLIAINPEIESELKKAKDNFIRPKFSL